MMQALLRLITLALVAATSSLAQGAAIDPQATQTVLKLLLAEAHRPIPASSSCQGDYGQSGSASIQDLLAARLAYLYSGKNILKGSCGTRRCTLSITHAAGEDVASTTIRFDVEKARLKLTSLQCVLTP